MPTACEPCPGNKNAIFVAICNLFYWLGLKDLTQESHSLKPLFTLELVYKWLSERARL
jgi:hypothetical protein